MLDRAPRDGIAKFRHWMFNLFSGLDSGMHVRDSCLLGRRTANNDSLEIFKESLSWKVSVCARLARSPDDAHSIEAKLPDLFWWTPYFWGTSFIEWFVDSRYIHESPLSPRALAAISWSLGLSKEPFGNFWKFGPISARPGSTSSTQRWILSIFLSSPAAVKFAQCPYFARVCLVVLLFDMHAMQKCILTNLEKRKKACWVVCNLAARSSLFQSWFLDPTDKRWRESQNA